LPSSSPDLPPHRGTIPSFLALALRVAAPCTHILTVPSCRPRQLRDLPKMLLSKAEEDWRGQLRALRHAEYLIRAAPDELAAYAGVARGGVRLSGLASSVGHLRHLTLCMSGRRCFYAACPVHLLPHPSPPTPPHTYTHLSVSPLLHPPTDPPTPPAVPLARALIHTKVPPWMDQEMPEGGPPANMQRFRCAHACCGWVCRCTCWPAEERPPCKEATPLPCCSDKGHAQA
jgi:hypothetical protein